jgi:Uma2 family endonuclease
MRIATKRQEYQAMTIETTAKVGDRVFMLPNSIARNLPTVPPLENGDHLTRAEFERRYEAMPWLNKAELIEGVVYMGSPVRSEVHAEPHATIVTWTGVYRAATPGVKVADNGTLRLDADNEPQPDVMLRIDARAGGASWLSLNDYVEGAPELVIEVAASSASLDLGDKRTVYRRNGVREYIVWQIYDRRVDWWALREGEYQPLLPDDAGVLRSEVFPGLWLDVPALIADNLANLLATLQHGLASNEHAAFVAQLTAQLSSTAQ